MASGTFSSRRGAPRHLAGPVIGALLALALGLAVVLDQQGPTDLGDVERASTSSVVFENERTGSVGCSVYKAGNVSGVPTAPAPGDILGVLTDSDQISAMTQTDQYAECVGPELNLEPNIGAAASIEGVTAQLTLNASTYGAGIYLAVRLCASPCAVSTVPFYNWTGIATFSAVVPRPGGGTWTVGDVHNMTWQVVIPTDCYSDDTGADCGFNSNAVTLSGTIDYTASTTTTAGPTTAPASTTTTLAPPPNSRVDPVSRGVAVDVSDCVSGVAGPRTCGPLWAQAPLEPGVDPPTNSTADHWWKFGVQYSGGSQTLVAYAIRSAAQIAANATPRTGPMCFNLGGTRTNPGTPVGYTTDQAAGDYGATGGGVSIAPAVSQYPDRHFFAWRPPASYTGNDQAALNNACLASRPPEVEASYAGTTTTTSATTTPTTTAPTTSTATTAPATTSPGTTTPGGTSPPPTGPGTPPDLDPVATDCDITWNPSTWGRVVGCFIPEFLKQLLDLIGWVVREVWDALKFLGSTITGLFGQLVPTQNPIDGVVQSWNTGIGEVLTQPLVVAKAAWEGLGSGAVGGCQGPEVHIPGGPAWGGFDIRPLDSCSGPTQTAAGYIRPVLEAMIWGGAVLACIRALLGAFGIKAGSAPAEGTG